MIRKIAAIGMLAVLAFSLTACDESSETESTASGSTAQIETVEVPEGAIVDASGTFVYTGELKQGGSAENGYIKVPIGYVEFQEEGVEGLTQYCDPTGTNIITLDYYEDIDYETAANSMYYYKQEEEGIEGLTGATVTVNGYNSLQLYCHYIEDDKFLVQWLIEDPANTANCYYLAIEFINEDSGIMACSSTFQTAADYQAENPQ